MTKNVIVVINDAEIDTLIERYTKDLKGYEDNVLLSNIRDILITLGVKEVEMSKEYINVCIDMIQYILYKPISTGITLIPDHGYISLDIERVDDYIYVIMKSMEDKNVIF